MSDLTTGLTPEQTAIVDVATEVLNTTGLTPEQAAIVHAATEVLDTSGLTPKEALIVGIAIEAFIYGLPLVLIDLTKEQSVSSGHPVNSFYNRSSFCDASNTSVVRPNCDTFYSSAFFDLSETPVVMTIPETDSQYYLMPLLDAFTNVIPGSPGTRTNEITGGNYLLVGPNPNAQIPSGMDTSGYTVIKCPTSIVWAIGRFQVNTVGTSVNSAGLVTKLQSKLSITPLTSTAPPTPNTIVCNMSIADYFTQLNNLLCDNPPTPADAPAMKLFGQIGVGPDATTPFAEMIFASAVSDAMGQIPKAIINKYLGMTANPSTSNDGSWIAQVSRLLGNYGIHYNIRGKIAVNGLGCNLNADAVYFSTSTDSVGSQLDCSTGNKYTLTFPSQGTDVSVVPVKAFWSVTLYNSAGFFVENSISRYAVGHDTEHPLVPDADGNVTIYIQPESPSEHKNNWLPAPSNESFNLMLRAYYPKDAITHGHWMPPKVVLAS